ncbi:MAG: LptF/LptG family permease [Phycisphaerales bacterium]|nr:LptF/LptG family permease [Phycisphaerales bacterium]
MNTLDRYIARQYLFNVIALLVVLFSFVVAVDFALNIDAFFSAADKLNPDGGAFRRLVLMAIGVLDIWWPRLLQLFNYLVGLVLVAAMGFTFTQLSRNREIVAVLAGGISLHRVARPVLIVALCVMGLRLINSEFVLSNPRVAPLLTRDQNDIGKRNWSEVPVRLERDGQNRILLAEKFDPAAGVLEKITIWERDPAGIARRAITAEKAVWTTPSPSAPASDGWYELTSPVLLPLTLGAGGSANEMQGQRAPTRLQTDLNPEALKLRRFKRLGETLSWSQIGEMLDTAQPELRDKLQRIRWGRLSETISSILAIIITLPFFLTREPKNMVLQSLKCAPVGIFTLVGGVFLSGVPWPLLPPGFAAFVPVLILVPVAVASVSWMKT